MAPRFALFAAAFLLPLCACGGPNRTSLSAVPPASRALAPSKYGLATKWPIGHVIIIVQENRSVDNVFNGFPGANTAASGLNRKGQQVALQPTSLSAGYDLEHTHGAFLTEYHGGKMDGFNLEQSTPYLCKSNCPPNNKHGVLAYGYVPQSETGPYWQMAKQYAFGDAMFQTNSGPSFPAHQFLIAGTSLVNTRGTLLASENTHGPAGALPRQAGCQMISGSYVMTIDPASGIESKTVFPCLEHQTLMDSLDAAGISWKYYTAWPGGTNSQYVLTFWAAPYAIKHLYQSPDMSKVVYPETTVLGDIQNGKLPQVSWVTPAARDSDHAGVTDGSGPDWVAAVVNAVGASQYWNDTAIFVTWDDWGGWYDHVPPQQIDKYEFGMRVPLIVVSPYAQRGYVSHVQHNFGSILKFVEEDFSLPSLGYADAGADDLSDCFKFSAMPARFKTIAARRSAQYFLRGLEDGGGIPDDE